MSETKLPELLFISWEEFHRMSFELSQQVKSLRPDLDQIISISRGGHVLSRILSDFLDLQIFSVSIQSYTDIQEQSKLQLTQMIEPELIESHVLLVDEIVDSGKTLKRALEYLDESKSETVTSVALHVKPKAIMKPDFYVEETNKWVVYPYEVRETLISLKPLWEKAGMNQEDMLYQITQAGMNEVFAKFFLDEIYSNS